MPKTTLQTIWKFHLMVIDKQTVMMPEGSIVLCVQMLGGNPCLWAMVDPAAALRERSFRIIGTGDEIKDNPGNYCHLSNVGWQFRLSCFRRVLEFNHRGTEAQRWQYNMQLFR